MISNLGINGISSTVVTPGGGGLSYQRIAELSEKARGMSLESAPSVVCCTAWYQKYIMYFWWYGSISLQQSSKESCNLHVSSHNLRTDCQRLTLVPPLNSGAYAAPLSVQCHYSAITDAGRGNLETTGNRVFDISFSHGMNGVSLSYCYSGDYPSRG